MSLLKRKIHFIHFDSIDSTSSWAKRNAASLDPLHITCITALEQTAGKGRFSRKWLSPKGQNILATFYFTIAPSAPYLVNLGQILSLSCIHILEKKGFHPKVKWPNDIQLNGKKVAGILCETTMHDGRWGVALSIGLNVNMSEELLAQIDQPATSLAQLSGKTWNIEQILEPLLQQFLKDLETLETKGFEAFQSDYENHLAYKGKTITCNDGAQTIKGICHSINAQGRLNLQMDDGHFKTISAGELKITSNT